MAVKDYIKGLEHLGIPTNDLDKSVAFYKGLGFETLLTTVVEASSVRVAFLGQKGLVLEIYEDHKAVMKPGAVEHVAIDVTDIEKAYAAVREAGYAILEEIQFLPFWENGVRYFKIEGPNAEIIEFLQKL